MGHLYILSPPSLPPPFLPPSLFSCPQGSSICAEEGPDRLEESEVVDDRCKTVFSGHSRAPEHMDSQCLWLLVQYCIRSSQQKIQHGLGICSWSPSWGALSIDGLWGQEIWFFSAMHLPIGIHAPVTSPGDMCIPATESRLSGSKECIGGWVGKVGVEVREN